MPTSTPLDMILANAVDITSAEERQKYLDEACGTDLPLRQQVQNMLDDYLAAGSFLETPAVDLPATISMPLETKGQLIGPYKLLEKLGEGGMGTVWIAEREKPVRQRVALKLIKPGMDSAQVLRRFEAERQALALMSHHNIARMLDAGSTEAGRPYFVMELVKGVPITKYCDEVHASIEKRLQLFIPVCLAVQHAHQKGIIHRDIKPSNVLVCMEDGQPVPKVIDFGVAKALYQPLTEGTLHTAFNQVVGTLEYMSPEQAELNALDIDTRADIYALGVLLFELLTGTTPITREELKSLALMGMLRKIKESEPKKPSTRLSESKETLASVAASRRTDPRKLMKEVSGDLDWIVLKCLEPDRMLRYDTANALAREIERHLANEPVDARAPSKIYRFKKFAWRNRWALTAASLILMALVVGVIGLAWGLREAEQGRQLAEQKEGEVKKALEQEAKERKYAQAIADFVKDDFLALTSVEGQDRFGEGSNALGKNATLRDLLDRAASKLDNRKDLDSRTEAELRWIIGVSYRYIGEMTQAISNLERSDELLNRHYSSDDKQLFSARNSLAVAYAYDGQYGKALSLLEELFKKRKTILGLDHPDTLSSMSNLASTYARAGKLGMALPLLEETLKLTKAKLGADHRDTISSMNSLAVTYLNTGKLDLALPLLVEILELRKANLGANHLDTLTSMNDLAQVYIAAGKLELALPLCEETFNQRKAKLGVEHPKTLSSMHALADCYAVSEKLDLAQPLLEEALKLQKAKLGDDHPDALITMSSLALCFLERGKQDLALPLFEDALKLQKAKLGDDHYDTLRTMSNLAYCYFQSGKLDLAVPLFEVTLKLQKSKLGKDHPKTLMTMSNLSSCYMAARKLDRALPLIEETLKLQKAKFGDDHPNTPVFMNTLARCYFESGKLDLALPLIEETHKLQKTKFGSDHPNTLRSMQSLAVCYLDSGKQDLALPLLEETLKLHKSKFGVDHPRTLICMNNLASCYKDTGKLDMAMPLYLEAALKAEKLNFQFQNAERILDNLIDFLESLKQFDQAENWRRKWLALVKTRTGADSLPYTGQLATLSQNLLRQEKWTNAESMLRECLAIREKKQPDAWSTFNTQSMLGEALLGQKKYAEAEPLLLKGYEGMKQREKTIPPQGKIRIPEALERLIQLYEQTNKPAEAAKWRAELQKLQPQQAKEPPKP